jgi:pantoate--beta-alanine ligase
MNLDIVICPTVREPDGLAMSSRNTYLKPEERKAAVVLSKSLELAREMYTMGERDAQKIRSAMIDFIHREPLAGKIDYISIADIKTLEESDFITPPVVISLAVKIGKPRLLDNIILE